MKWELGGIKWELGGGMAGRGVEWHPGEAEWELGGWMGWEVGGME